MDRGKTLRKLTFEDGRDGAASILEDMVVKDQESRRRYRQPEIHTKSSMFERSRLKIVSSFSPKSTKS